MSKNAITIEQLNTACRHVIELMDAGMTENLAIRNLELFANVYAKCVLYVAPALITLINTAIGQRLPDKRKPPIRN